MIGGREHVHRLHFQQMIALLHHPEIPGDGRRIATDIDQSAKLSKFQIITISLSNII
jgi:hypothetical protein